MWHALLEKVGHEGLSDEIIFEEILERIKGVSHLDL